MDICHKDCSFPSRRNKKKADAGDFFDKISEGGKSITLSKKNEEAMTVL